MHFATPEASWKLAGGGASNASENHWITAKKTSTPAGGAGMDGNEDGTRVFLAPLPGRISFLHRIRWFPLPSVASPPANFRCPSGT
jgi:hypothetical protein